MTPTVHHVSAAFVTCRAEPSNDFNNDEQQVWESEADSPSQVSSSKCLTNNSIPTEYYIIIERKECFRFLLRFSTIFRDNFFMKSLIANSTYVSLCRKVHMKFVWSIPRSANFYFELCAYYKEEMGLLPGPAKEYLLHFVNGRCQDSGDVLK